MMSILLNEMPMVVVSSNPNRLIQVMSTLLSLLRPFKWQHMYIPVIPTSCANMIGGAIGLSCLLKSTICLSEECVRLKQSCSIVLRVRSALRAGDWIDSEAQMKGK